MMATSSAAPPPEPGFQASPPSSTPTMVRSRPKIPSIFGGAAGGSGGGGEEAGVEDLVGVISTLGTTDFVEKYSTKRRRRTGAGGGGGVGGVNSPASLVSPTSPRAKSPPTADGRSTITLTRMRSIKLKLEQVKERQERAAEASKAAAAAAAAAATAGTPGGGGGGAPRRKTGTVEPPYLQGMGAVYVSQDSLGGSIHQSTSTPSLDRSESDRSEKTLSTSSPSVILSMSDSRERVNDLQQFPSSENVESYALDNRVNVYLSDSISPIVDSGNNSRGKTITVTDGGGPHQHSISENLQSNVDSVKSTSIAGDGLVSAPDDRRATRLGGQAPPVQRDEKGGVDSANEMEDEGIGAMDIEEEPGSLDPRLLDAKLSLSRNVPTGNRDTTAPGKTGSTGVTAASLPCRSGVQDLPTKLQQEESSAFGSKDARQAGEPGPGKRVNGNSRFLTHPPSSDKPLGQEGGSVDSNGLGALRTNKEPVKTNELTSQVSEVSIDSHLCPSDTSETPTYRDVVIDVTSEPTDAEKFEKRNNKSFKHKSKSDPSGKKQKQIEGVDIPVVIGAHTQSVPVLTKQIEEVDTFLPPLDITEDVKGRSKSENLLSKPPKSPHPHISRLRESPLTKSTSEESSEEALPPVQRLVKARKALKKRKLDILRHPPPERDSSREELELPSHAATLSAAPSSTPEGAALERQTAHTSLTLPLAAKSKPHAINRSHSSAVDYGSKGANFSPSLGGARPKSDKVKSRKGRPPIPEPLTTQKSFTWSGSGSSPEVGSPSGRPGDRATYSPRLDTIFSGSSLSLFEGAAEDKVRADYG